MAFGQNCTSRYLSVAMMEAGDCHASPAPTGKLTDIELSTEKKRDGADE